MTKQFTPVTKLKAVNYYHKINNYVNVKFLNVVKEVKKDGLKDKIKILIEKPEN
jgi:hypothetical protein